MQTASDMKIAMWCLVVFMQIMQFEQTSNCMESYLRLITTLLTFPTNILQKVLNHKKDIF